MPNNTVNVLANLLAIFIIQIWQTQINSISVSDDIYEKPKYGDTVALPVLNEYHAKGISWFFSPSNR